MKNRFEVLDGWRGISISFVLAGHLLPLGPNVLGLNASVATSGMALFFILSGFLITNILLKDQNIRKFIIRRLFRILPIAWLVLLITFVIVRPPWDIIKSYVFFYANNSESVILSASHFWSLCLEIQFYFAIAILVFIFKKRALYILPLVSLLITINRYLNGMTYSVETLFRIDEILAGCILALIFTSDCERLKRFIAKLNPLVMLILLLASAHSYGGILAYFRPYMAMLLIGATLLNDEPSYTRKILSSRLLFYIASISYALYVVHGGLRYTWLASGDDVVKYLKRPLFFLVNFGLAHLSTRYYEKYWIDLGKRLTSK